MSKRIINRIKAVSDSRRILKNLRKITSGKLFEIFKKSGDAALDICIVSNRLDLLRDLSKFKKICGKGLLTAEEVTRISGVISGIDLGKMLLLIKKAQFEGRLKSRREAIYFIKSIHKSKNE